MGCSPHEKSRPPSKRLGATTGFELLVGVSHHKIAAMGWEKHKATGYAAFAAQESDVNDGSESCKAIFKITLSGTEYTYSGKSGGQYCSHAEMNAIHQCITAEHAPDTNQFRTAVKIIECTAKACCYECSAVLGLLGVTPTAHTYKTSKPKSGWGLSIKMKEFLNSFCPD